MSKYEHLKMTEFKAGKAAWQLIFILKIILVLIFINHSLGDLETKETTNQALVLLKNTSQSCFCVTLVDKLTPNMPLDFSRDPLNQSFTPLHRVD